MKTVTYVGPARGVVVFGRSFKRGLPMVVSDTHAAQLLGMADFTDETDPQLDTPLFDLPVVELDEPFPSDELLDEDLA
jgi:hypothetical protein